MVSQSCFFKGLGLLIELTIPGFAPETPIDPSFRREKPRYIAQTYWDNWLRDVEGNMCLFQRYSPNQLEKLAAAKKLLFGQERNAKWLQLKHPSYLILLASEKKGENLPFPQAELSEKLYAVWSPGAKKLQPL